MDRFFLDHRSFSGGGEANCLSANEAHTVGSKNKLIGETSEEVRRRASSQTKLLGNDPSTQIWKAKK